MDSPLRNPTIHITTHNASGKSVIHSSDTRAAIMIPDHKVGLNNVYTTSSMPANLNDEIDIGLHRDTISSGQLGLVKPNGTVCRFVDVAPGSTGLMHRTQSLDYGLVVEGNVLMELDDGSITHMTRGDVAVQRGTMHSWRNASETEWARMFFVLQDCQPIVVGGKTLKEDIGIAAEILPSSGNDV